MNINTNVSLNKNGLFLGLTVTLKHFDTIKEKPIIGHASDGEEVYFKVIECSGVTVMFTRGKV